jgi:iron complex outermembrane receptor protein
VRYTDEQKDARLASLAECSFDFSVCDFSFSDSQGWDFLSGHAGIQWFVSDDINLFVSWNRSFRSGGYNVRNASPATVPGPYDEEQVDAFELGLKSDWLDGRLRLNAAVFQNNYQDLQRTVLDLSLAQRILNAAEAEIRGVELEAFALITDRLSVQASVGLLDAEYAEFNGLDVDGDGAPDPAAAADLDLANVPELTGHLAATYDLPLDGLGTLTFRGSYSYTDGSPANDQNTIFVSSFSLIDASMTFADTSQRWRVSLFGKNLSDEVYARFAVTSSLFNFDYALPPRTWGLEVSYEM